MIILIAIIIVGIVAVNYVLKEMNGGVSILEQKRIDRINWNNGNCHRCGYHWTLYKYDRDLGRIYVCTKCDEMTHVITGVDKDYSEYDDPDYKEY